MIAHLKNNNFINCIIYNLIEIIDILISMISVKGAVVISSDSPFQKRRDRFTMNLYLYYFLV